MSNRYLRLLTNSLVAMILVLGAAACTIELPIPTGIEEQVETIQTLLTPEVASPQATPLPPTPTPIPPTPTPEISESAYSSDSMGLSMWYPEGWWVEEEEGQVIFATSEEVITADEIETGAAMLVILVPTEETGLMGLEEWFEDTTLVFASGPDMETGDTEPRTIGGQDGLIVTFEGVPEYTETALRGFMAGAEFEGLAYFFLAVSVLDEWAEYASDLEAMLDSVAFTARIEPTFTPDGWEPDDSLADANPIQAGESQTHNLHVEGDQDWVYFEAEAGTTYVIETSNLGYDIDTVIELYDPEENQLDSDDDGAGEPLASRLEWTAEGDGTLYVMIKDYGDSSAGRGSDYDISVSEM